MNLKAILYSPKNDNFNYSNKVENQKYFIEILDKYSSISGYVMQKYDLNKKMIKNNFILHINPQ
ncbi:hypothetical protein FHS70_000266 [Flammeovirga yaeyamensis]|nr:hypothetical protein [Flammeovirga yaeyamensis]